VTEPDDFAGGGIVAVAVETREPTDLATAGDAGNREEEVAPDGLLLWADGFPPVLGLVFEFAPRTAPIPATAFLAGDGEPNPVEEPVAIRSPTLAGNFHGVRPVLPAPFVDGIVLRLGEAFGRRVEQGGHFGVGAFGAFGSAGHGKIPPFQKSEGSLFLMN